ncbi:PREDICTED: uncharacterized protein LOC105461378, partial [Wasmannia auropunctata]|uniref:uncharacterized protein LOC105461378 n=1 Tax=Wasmannia auropunctata TaxID=64793 RepID=UPI0005EE780A
LKKIRIEGLYDFDIHLLVNLANKGPVTITADDVGLKINIDAKEIIKNGKKQIYASKVNTHLNVTDVKYEFGDTKKELVQLHQALRNVVDSNIKDVVDSIVLVVQKNISELTIKIFNYISRSNYEKLFADKV